MKKVLSRVLALILCVSMLAEFAPAAGAADVSAVEVLPSAEISDGILHGDYFYLANDSVTLQENDNSTYLFTVGRGGDAADSADITVLFRDFTAAYGVNYTASEYGGSEATVPDGHMSYVEVLAGADSYEEYPLISEEDAEEYLLNSAEEVESYLTSSESTVETASSGTYGDAAGAFDGNPLAEVHAETAGRSLNRIPVSGDSDIVTVNKDTGEVSGGSTDADPDDLTNEFTAEETEGELSASDSDATIPPAEIKLTFAPGEKTKLIAVTPVYSSEAEGDAMFMMALSAPSDGMELSSHNSIMVTIADTDEVQPAVLSFDKAEITADGDSVFVTVNREGAINRTVSAQIYTEEIDAEGYADFSPLGAQLIFPFGVMSRTVEIPVNHIRDSVVTFRVALSPESDCTVSDTASSAIVSIAPYVEEIEQEASDDSDIQLMGTSLASSKVPAEDRADFDRSVDLSAVSIIGSGYYSGNGAVSLTTHDIDSGITSGILLDNSTDPTWRSYAYDGYLVNWQLDEGFWFPDYEIYMSGKDTATGKTVRSFLITDDDGYEDSTWTAMYFGKSSLYDTRIAMCTSFGSGNDLNIYSVTPIKREFRVELLPATKLKFKNTSEVESASYHDAVINDQKVSSTGERYSVKYVGDTVSVTATDANHYLILSGVEVCKADGTVLGYIPSSNTASDTCSIDLDLDFFDIYGADFDYEENPDVYTRSEAGTVHALTGTIYLRPCFNFRNVSLTIQADADGRGYFTEFPDAGSMSSYHMGDVITLTGAVYSKYAASVDVTAYAFTTRENIQKDSVSGTIMLGTSGKASLTLRDESVTLRPITTERSNSLVVTVSKADYEKFDRSQGIFAVGDRNITYNSASGQYEITVVPAGSLSNGSICTLAAVTSENGTVPVWTEFGSERTYCGTAFYHTAGGSATENVIHLSVSSETSSRWLQGYLYYSNVNINTSRSADASFPASGQVIGAGGASSSAGTDGYFETEAFAAVPGCWVRYITASNGNARLGEIYVSSGSGAINTGMITVPAQTSSGVSVDRVSVEQNGYYMVQTIPLGGVKTIFRASVTDNVPYTVGNETLTEKITGVYFIVYDGKTMEKKSTFIAKKSENYASDPVWVADAGLLTPENSLNYAAGDYLYVEVVSDRRVASFEGASEAETIGLTGVVYTPQYCGFTFTSTDSYEPVLMEVAIPLTAENIMSGDFKTFYSKEESASKRKFVSLPFIGALDTQISAAKITKNNIAYSPDESDWGSPGSYGSQSASSSHKPAVNVTVTVETRPNGVTRLKIGAAVTYMNSTETTISRSRSSRFAGLRGQVNSVFENIDPNAESKGGGTGDLIYESLADKESDLKKSKNFLQGQYGGTSMTFSIQFGFYVDFGLVSDDDSAIGAHFILMGLGGYLGFAGSIGYTQYFIVPVISIPGFIGFTGSLAVLGSIGGTGDPENALNYDEQDSSFIVNDFCGNFEATLNGIASLTGYLGIGIKGVVSIRGTATVTFTAGMDNTYPDLYENCPWWGVDLTFTLGMVIDFAIFSLPFTLAGWDLWQEGFYKYFTELENGTDLMSASDGGSTVLGYSYQKRTGGSEFTGGESDAPALQSTFAYDSKTVDKVIAENIYSQPSTKMVSLDEGKILMVYLDDDPSKADDQITSLYWTVYDGSAWSRPQAVQNDDTGDFTPSLTDCGDRVLISWSSSADTSAETDIDHLMDLEIYAAFFDKKTETVGTPERLTNDIYFDSHPVGVYDEGTGSIALYYTKNAPEMEKDKDGNWVVSPDVSLLDVTNDLNSVTYSVICYRLFEGGEWTEKYFGEYTDEQIKSVINPGERYLDTEVVIKTDSGTNTDPVVTDFCAAPGYNNLAVFSYCIDLDNDYSTEDDRELFLQVYNFKEHKVYHPTRLTKNSISESMPQLVRGDGVTRLFWLAGDESIFYVNISDILRYGLNEDGSLKSVTEAEQCAAANESDCDVRLHKVDLRQKGISDDTGSAPTDFLALTDSEGSMYILWGNGEYDSPDDDATVSVTREIYAVGMVMGEGGVAWSEPVKLTDTGLVNDGFTAVTDSENRLMIASRRYKMTYDTKAENDPLYMSPVQLVTVSLANVGSTEVTGITLSDRTPLPGDDVEITVTVKNTGLTAAKGFTLNLSESKSGKKIGSTVSVSEELLPGCSQSFRFTWTVPRNFDGISFTATAKETGYTNVSEFVTEPLKAQAAYSLELLNGYQSGDDFFVDYSVENIGNAKSGSGDRISLTFVNLYGKDGSDFGFESGSDEIVAKSDVLKLDAGDTASGTLKLTLPDGAFDLYGYIDLTGHAEASDGTKLSVTQEIFITQTALTCLTIGGGKAVTVNGSKRLTVSYNSGKLKKPTDVVFSVADGTLAKVRGSRIIALADGKTTLTATLLPYGTSVTVPLTVKVGDGEGSLFEDVFKSDYFFESVVWADENGITYGTDEYHFSPYKSATRAEIVCFLYRVYCGSHGTSKTSAGCPFVDVKSDAYYYDAVLWAAENGITSGTDAKHFSPDKTATRAEIVCFLYRAYLNSVGGKQAVFNGVRCPFADVSSSAYYYDAVLWAISNGITYGTDATHFSPDMCVDRAQAVTFLHRFCASGAAPDWKL